MDDDEKVFIVNSFSVNFRLKILSVQNLVQLKENKVSGNYDLLKYKCYWLLTILLVWETRHNILKISTICVLRINQNVEFNF